MIALFPRMLWSNDWSLQFLHVHCLSDTGYVYQWIISAAMAASFLGAVILCFLVRMIIIAVRARKNEKAAESAALEPDVAQAAAAGFAVKPTSTEGAGGRADSAAGGMSEKAAWLRLRQRGVRLAFAVPSLFYMRMTTLALQSFLCVNNNLSGIVTTSVLAADMTLTCGGPDHSPVLAGSIVIAVLLTVALPITVIVLLRKHRDALQLDVCLVSK